MDEIDTLFMVGTNFPYTKHLPTGARVAQIEADPARAGARVATEVPVVGDAREGLRGLLPLLKRRSDTSFLNKCQKEMGTWRRRMTALEDSHREPIAAAVPDERGERGRRPATPSSPATAGRSRPGRRGTG